jgi:predicted amidohydrolase
MSDTNSRYAILVLVLLITLFSSFLGARTIEPGTVRVAGIILKWAPKDKSTNFEHADLLIREAASKGAEIVCTTECFLDGYCIREESLSDQEFKKLSEPLQDGIFIDEMKQLAMELGIYLIAGISELSGEKIFNSAVLIDPSGTIAGVYRKKYLWGSEKERYKAGKSFPVFETKYGNVGMMICADRRRPEAVAELKENGADIIFCPSGGGYGKENVRVMSQRSSEVNLPIIFVHPNEFLVTGPTGDILDRYMFGHNFDVAGNESPSGIIRLYDLKLTGINFPDAH